jgi:hypothetical protein
MNSCEIKVFIVGFQSFLVFSLKFVKFFYTLTKALDHTAIHKPIVTVLTGMEALNFTGLELRLEQFINL